MKFIQSLIIGCILCVGFVLIPTQLFAQSGLSINFNPQYPKPSQSFTVSLSSFSTSIQTSLVRWEHEGELLREGVGLSQITFQTARDTSLSVTVTDRNGSVFTQNIPVTVSDVDVLWQVNNAYVPPFYKGKALPVEEAGVISVVAIPNRPERNSFLYRFQRNGVDVIGQGGLGKSSFDFSSSAFDNGNTISAVAQNLNGDIAISGFNVVNYAAPEVVFYERDSRLSTSLGRVIKNNHTVSGDSISLVAVPFFVSLLDINQDNLRMDWTVGSASTQVPGPKNQISVAITPGQRGIVPIELFVENTARIFEKGTVRLNLNFN